MEFVVAVISGFLLACVAPGLQLLLPQRAGSLLALLPIALCVYFGGFVGTLPAEGTRVFFSWVPSLGLNVSFHLDGLSLLFALLICGIGALILIYAESYLKGHPQLGRLYLFLLLFMASMLGLVLADNLLTLFIFWELTSFSSYLLIGFDHERAAARAAALKALLITGGGGLALLAGLLLLAQAGSDLGLPSDQNFEITALLSLGEAVRGHALYTPVLLLVLLGAFTKSAQFPFHFWLPSAMEAPTPVSAYLHSATMVKAGIYLLARLSPLLGGTDLWFWANCGCGAVTMVLGAALALQEVDLKRILAFSTISALGLLVMLLGVGTEAAVAALLAFLLAHAMYKGALFLLAGAVDHGTGTRDVMQLSGLGRAMPITAALAVLAAVSMAGLPPLFGFIAKEMVIESLTESSGLLVLLAALVLSGMMIVAVAAVVGIFPFFGKLGNTPEHPHEAGMGLLLGPALLSICGLVAGILPALVDEPVLAPALAATLHRAEAPPLRLALWHGFNPALALSGLSLVGGVVFIFARGQVRRMLPRIVRFGPAQFYDLGLSALNGVARLQTQILQSGYLRYYLLTTMLTAIALVGTTLIARGQVALPTDWQDVEFYEAGLVILIALATFAAVLWSSRLAAISALGVVGYGVALIFVFYGAPDLAMTQFLIETLTVILFVLVFYHLPPARNLSTYTARFRDGLISITLGGLMTLLVLIAVHAQLPAPPQDSSKGVTAYYSEASLPEAHGRNIVNVILVDFRGLDTLGEITVLAVAAIGVYALLKLRPKVAAKTANAVVEEREDQA